MTNIDVSNFPFSNDRAILRKEIITLFLDEDPGTGKGALTTRYHYITKTLGDGRKVYLKRPAQFNNGFDFTLNVSDTNFNDGSNKRYSTRPTHDNIYNDLWEKKEKNPKLYQIFFEQIDLIFLCQNPSKTNFNFNVGHSTELILECIKWLFIEQDVTYWNYSGRHMFYNGINEI